MYNITLIKGDGIGPEVTAAACKVVEATGLAVNWEVFEAGAELFAKRGYLLADAAYASIERNKLCLKGPITTPIGKGFRSINVMLRKRYDLYANVRPVKSIKGLETPFDNVDLTIFRENTEGIYSGVEEQIDEETAHSIKIITKKGSDRIIRSAFEYALKNGKKSVTVVHKANIMKLTDGLFQRCAQAIAKDYPSIAMQEVLVDNMCMQLVMNPSAYEVIVTTNLYGDILSDLCAGLVGGLGLVPGGNYNEDMAIFEAVHGSAPDIAGKNQANPSALIFSAAMLLEHIGEQEKSKKIIRAVEKVIYDGEFTTKDLGGNGTTTTMTEAIINNLVPTERLLNIGNK